MKHRIIFINRSNEVVRGYEHWEFESPEKAHDYVDKICGRDQVIRDCYFIVNDENEHQILMQRKLENTG